MIKIKLFVLVIIATTFTFGQNLTVPRISPHAKVEQTIGISEVEIEYHRPAVRGRKIWGGLVPYGLQKFNFGSGNPAPWRAGANENTTISFSHDAYVNGNKIPKGKYGFHIIPTENEWTLIFSRDNESWGSFFYDPANDQLRIKVKPEEAPFKEWMQFYFDDLTPNSAMVYLHWEKKRIGFEVKFDVPKIVLENMKKELKGINGFRWASWNQAAKYALENSDDIELALSFVNKALELFGGMNFTNLQLKSDILKKMGKIEESEEVHRQALAIAGENELNQYGYQLLNAGNTEEALKIFEMNVKRFPSSWNVYDSYAEALYKAGKKEEAAKYYQKALNLAPEDQKERIKQVMNSRK
ncbi:MAG: DUF2911 domain-containing protein [Ignavibacteria bacterium]|nr:MAG: DUF2911 domain-containing protein [Ignavibacteria bacterium]